MIVVSWEPLTAAVGAWRQLYFVDWPAHPRFCINFLDAEAVSHIFLEDVLGWVQSWDDECLGELRSSLEYFLAHEVEKLGYPNVIGNIEDEQVESIWLPLFEAVFEAEPQIQPRDLYEVKHSLQPNESFASRLPAGPVFTWDTPAWRTEVKDQEFNGWMNRRIELVQATSADDLSLDRPVPDQVTTYDASFQGYIGICLALDAHDREPFKDWIPPTNDVLATDASFGGNSKASDWLFGKSVVYSTSKGLAALPVDHCVTQDTLDIAVLIAQLAVAAQVMGIELSGDSDKDIESAREIDRTRALRHEPWKAWAVLWEAAHSSHGSNSYLRMRRYT